MLLFLELHGSVFVFVSAGLDLCLVSQGLCTLLSPRSQRPPAFEFDPATHDRH